mmetsp:Transcript_45882/g.105959  ORF Transcript_45882/g.105959 Transcript_45882/m.105959 type:complete len:212 (-) Transcript_45882:613-1248(-)
MSRSMARMVGYLVRNRRPLRVQTLAQCRIVKRRLSSSPTLVLGPCPEGVLMVSRKPVAPEGTSQLGVEPQDVVVKQSDSAAKPRLSIRMPAAEACLGAKERRCDFRCQVAGPMPSHDEPPSQVPAEQRPEQPAVLKKALVARLAALVASSPATGTWCAHLELRVVVEHCLLSEQRLTPELWTWKWWQPAAERLVMLAAKDLAVEADHWCRK